MLYENNIFLNGVKLISQERKGKYVLIYLEDGSILKKCDVKGKEIEIECNECHTKNKIKFYNGILKRKYLCEKCLHYGERNPFYGKKHTQEMKEKLSKERKGLWYIGEKNPMYGIDVKTKMTPEKINQWKQHISEATKGEKNPMYGKRIKDYMTKESYDSWLLKHQEYGSSLSDEQKEKIGERFKQADNKWKERDPNGYIKAKQKAGHTSRLKQGSYKKSKIEIKVEEWLKENNLDYDYSCIMGFGNRCFQYDFIIHKKRILIEVQGDYWHGNPKIFNNDGSNGKRKLQEIQKQKMLKDEEKKHFALDKGFKVSIIKLRNVFFYSIL